MSVEALTDCFANSPLHGAQRVVHLAIADVVNDVHENRVWMRRAELAAKSGESRATVDRTLTVLVEQGWLTVLVGGGGRGKPTEYAYNLAGKPRQDEVVSEETASSERETASIPTPSQCSIPTTETARAEPYETEFAAAWELYPRKGDRKKALRAYVARRRAGARAADLMRATRNYAAARSGEPEKFTKLGATFYGPDEPYKDFLDDERVPDRLRPWWVREQEQANG